MAPKMTCRAFQPDKRTSAASPRRAHPASKGGNKSKSVSSSAKTTLRGSKARIWPPIWRFFLQVGVCVEHIAVAFPDIPQAMSGAADGIIGQMDMGVTFGVALQERHRPIACQIAELIGRDNDQLS